ERRRREPLLGCLQQFVGHDLPNRLVAAQGLARLLLAEAGPGLDADARRLLGRLADLVRLADAEARRLSELGRLCRDAGPATATPLSDAARDAVEETFLLSPARAVEYHVQDTMPTVLAPARAVRRALVELLRNAAQAAPPDRTPRVRVTAVAGPDGIACSVAAGGRGLPPGRLGRLGGLLSAGRVEAVEGRGLFLVRQLAVLWGGGVRLRSEAGQGMTATLLFRPPTTPGA